MRLLGFDVVTAGLTKHFVLCSLCFGSALPERARSLRSPYAEVEPFGFAPSLKINSLDTNGVQTIYTHGGSRTHDPLLRRQLLYPTELREQVAPQYRKMCPVTSMGYRTINLYRFRPVLNRYTPCGKSGRRLVSAAPAPPRRRSAPVRENTCTCVPGRALNTI